MDLKERYRDRKTYPYKTSCFFLVKENFSYYKSIDF